MGILYLIGYFGNIAIEHIDRQWVIGTDVLSRASNFLIDTFLSNLTHGITRDSKTISLILIKILNSHCGINLLLITSVIQMSIRQSTRHIVVRNLTKNGHVFQYSSFRIFFELI